LELVSTTVASTAVAAAVAISTTATSTATIASSSAAAIAAVTSSVAANSGTTTTTAAAAAPFGCAINLDGATVELGLVQVADGFVGMIGARVGNKTEAAAATGLAVADNDGVFNLTKLLKLASQGIVVRGPGQTADEKFNRHDFGTHTRAWMGRGREKGERGLVKGLGGGKKGKNRKGA